MLNYILCKQSVDSRNLCSMWKQGIEFDKDS